MEARIREIKASNQEQIIMRVMPGHFATRHSHINYYIDTTAIKCQHDMARLAARELATYYRQSPIDTIVCLEETEVLAAFLAAELCEPDRMLVNSGKPMAIVTPEANNNGQLMFRDNLQHMITDRNVLILVASSTTGMTITHAKNCVSYYNGKISGIAAIFSAVDDAEGTPVHSIFSHDDLPDYATFSPHVCPDCRAKRKIDALVNNFGYTKL